MSDPLHTVEIDAPHCPTCTCGCTCGYGGLHDDGNPRCELNQRVIPSGEPFSVTVNRLQDEAGFQQEPRVTPSVVSAHYETGEEVVISDPGVVERITEAMETRVIPAVRHWVPDGEAQCHPCYDGTREGACDQRGCQCECRYPRDIPPGQGKP